MRVRPKPKLKLERTFDASIHDVWELCTTREGIESWWGPEGFSVAVRDLDLRPGGELVYEMTANGADQIEYMTQSGMPLLTVPRRTYEQIDPLRPLVDKDLAYIIDDVEPDDVETVIELTEVEDGMSSVLTFESKHDEQ